MTQKQDRDEKTIVLEKAMKLCSMQEKCISDIKKKLQGWKVEKENIDYIIAALLKEQFIDEARFAAAFVNDKFRFSKWGKIKIRYALRAKHLQEQTIIKALDGIDETAYLSLIEKEIKKKYKSLKSGEEKGKLFRFALSKGFEPEITGKIICQLKVES